MATVRFKGGDISIPDSAVDFAKKLVQTQSWWVCPKCGKEFELKSLKKQVIALTRWNHNRWHKRQDENAIKLVDAMNREAKILVESIESMPFNIGGGWLDFKPSARIAMNQPYPTAGEDISDIKDWCRE